MTAGMPSMDSLPLTTILIVPFSELGTKSAASRTKMMDQLLTNIKHVLKDVFSISWTKFRVLDERLIFAFKEIDMPRAIFALQHVPGILRLHSCVETQSNPVTIVRKVEALLERGHFQVDPEHIEIRALYILDQAEKRRIIDQVTRGLKEVASKHQGEEQASMPIHVELHGSTGFAYISFDQHVGLNGNPVGSENPLVAEIIGRPGDLVASIFAIKRGVVVTPVFFSIGENAIDPGVYKELLKYINDIIHLFHGFPVKKMFFVFLEKIQEALQENVPAIMEQYPCTCCIIARYLIIARILKEQRMTPFVIQGLGSMKDQTLSTCPLDKCLDPRLNQTNLALANPLLTKQQSWPSIFSQYYANCPVNSDESVGYTWNFCKLWKNTSILISEQDHVIEASSFLNNYVLENFSSLVKQIDDSFDFNA